MSDNTIRGLSFLLIFCVVLLCGFFLGVNDTRHEVMKEIKPYVNFCDKPFNELKPIQREICEVGDGDRV